MVCEVFLTLGSFGAAGHLVDTILAEQVEVEAIVMVWVYELRSRIELGNFSVEGIDFLVVYIDEDICFPDFGIDLGGEFNEGKE